MYSDCSHGIIATCCHAKVLANYVSSEEFALVGEVAVVCLGMALAHVHELQTTKGEALLFESLDDLRNQASLHAIGLNHDVSLLHREDRDGVTKTKHTSN
jgi:hypothetical protein